MFYSSVNTSEYFRYQSHISHNQCEHYVNEYCHSLDYTDLGTITLKRNYNLINTHHNNIVKDIYQKTSVACAVLLHISVKYILVG